MRPRDRRQDAGAILNVSSVAGVVGAPLLAAYSAAKHAVIGLTKSAAGEYARKGIVCDHLHPVPIDDDPLAPWLRFFETTDVYGIVEE